MIVKRKKENVFEIGENINVGYCHVLYRTGWRYYCALKYNNLPFLRLCLVCNIIQLSKCVKCKNDKRQQFVVCFLHFSCHSKVVFYWQNGNNVQKEVDSVQRTVYTSIVAFHIIQMSKCKNVFFFKYLMVNLKLPFSFHMKLNSFSFNSNITIRLPQSTLSMLSTLRYPHTIEYVETQLSCVHIFVYTLNTTEFKKFVNLQPIGLMGCVCQGNVWVAK